MSQQHSGEIFVAETASGSRARRADAEEERLIPAWARGETRPMSERERRLTAAVYSLLPGLVEQVRRAGTLPQRIAGSRSEIGLRDVIRQRGIDLELTEAEQSVYDAIELHGDLPDGRAVLIDARGARRREHG